MSYIHEKIVKVEVEKIKSNFMLFNRFYSVRQDITACALCDKDFQPNDSIHLAFIKNQKNQLLCEDCKTKAISGGAKEINW